MADPAYIDPATGVLSVTEAWVPLSTTEPTGTKLCQMISSNDGSTADWSQYMDLVVIVASKSAKSGSGDGDTLLGYFNNDTTSSYDVQYFRGNGVTVNASRTTAAYMQVGNSLTEDVDSNISASAVWHIFDINSGKHKTSVSRWSCDKNGTGTYTVGLYAFVWNNQAAITEIDLNMEDDDYDTGTMISLFGVLPSMLTTGTVA